MVQDLKLHKITGISQKFDGFSLTKVLCCASGEECNTQNHCQEEIVIPGWFEMILSINTTSSPREKSSPDKGQSPSEILNGSARKHKSLSLDLIRRLPKPELHCHLDGSVRISTIIQLAKEQGVELPSFKESELKKLVEAKHCNSLVEYLRGFDITLSVLQKACTTFFFTSLNCLDAITRVCYEGRKQQK